MPEQTDPSQANNKPPKLRPMGLGELLDTTFSLYRAHLRPFLGIASGYFIAMAIGVSICFFDDSVSRTEMITIWIFTVGAIFGASVFVISGLVCVSAQVYLGKTISMGAVLRQAARQFLRCFIGLLIFAVLAALSIFCILLPLVGLHNAIGRESTIFFGLLYLFSFVAVLVWYVTHWCFYAATILFEGVRTWAGLKHSRELVRHARWRIVGVMSAVFLLSITIGVILRTIYAFPLTFTGLTGVGDFWDNIRWMVFWELPTKRAELLVSYAIMYLINLGIDTFVMPIWVIGCTLLYFDQRIRKEGFDIEVMATRQGE